MMSGQTLSFWFYPKSTGDPGRDRNARTLQFNCLLFAVAIGIAVALDVISREPVPTQMASAVLGALCVAAVLNRAGQAMWAGRIVTLALLLCAVLRVLQARDGFRSHAMLMFPGLLLLSVMLLDRASYFVAAGIVIFTVAALGVAEKRGFWGAIPPVRTPTNYESIFLVDLTLLAFSVAGSRIVRDASRNVDDLRFSIRQLSTANIELRITAEALRESEQQIVSIYNTVRDVIFHLAVESESRFRFVSVNAAFLNVTGLSEKAVVGKIVNEVIPEPSLTTVLDKYRQAIEQKSAVLWEETSDYPTGRLTGEVTVVPVFNHKGICTHLVGSVHDITERKRAERALRESEARLLYKQVHFMDAQRLAKLGSWERNVETGDVHWSDEALRIFGASEGLPASLVGFLKCVHSEDREKVLKASGEVASSNGPVELSYRITRPDGDIRFVNAIVEAIRDDRGNPVRTVGSIQDITEQVKTERQLRESEKRLKDAERIAHLGYWDWNIQADRVSWSDEMFRIFGKPRDYLLDHEGFLQMVVLQDRERIAQSVTQCLTEKTGTSFEFRIAGPDGVLKTVYSTCEVSLGEQGLPTNLFGICQDITERKQMEEKLRISEQQLHVLAGTLLTAQEDERRRISHELHDNLTQQLVAVAMDLGILKRELRNVQESLKKRIRQLQTSVVEAAESSRHFAYELYPSALDDFGLAKALEAYCEDFGRDGIVIEFKNRSLPESMNKEVASCLFKVAQESLRNISKHARAQKAWVTLEGRGDHVTLEVRDDGVGFPVESLDAGGGLGVLIMRERVRSLKGFFAIRSSPEEGTAISVEIPLLPGQLPKTA